MIFNETSFVLFSRRRQFAATDVKAEEGFIEPYALLRPGLFAEVDN